MSVRSVIFVLLLWAAMSSAAVATSLNFGPFYVRFTGEFSQPTERGQVADLIANSMNLSPDDKATICSTPSSTNDGARQRATVRNMLIARHVAPRRLEIIASCEPSWTGGKAPSDAVMVILDWLKRD